MEQSPSWEAKTSWATQEIPRILLKPKVHSQEPATCPYPELHWSSPCPPPHPTSRRSILILSSHLRLGLPSGLLPSGFPTKAIKNMLIHCIRPRPYMGCSAWEWVSEWVSEWDTLYKFCQFNCDQRSFLYLYHTVSQRDFPTIGNLLSSRATLSFLRRTRIYEFGCCVWGQTDR
jgi:hypothetical protein